MRVLLWWSQLRSQVACSGLAGAYGEVEGGGHGVSCERTQCFSKPIFFLKARVLLPVGRGIRSRMIVSHAVVLMTPLGSPEILSVHQIFTIQTFLCHCEFANSETVAALLYGWSDTWIFRPR
jgi:hypothetical protein